MTGDADQGERLESSAGREMLAYASSRDYCVIEFERGEDGKLWLRDITDHVRELEEIATGDMTNA